MLFVVSSRASRVTLPREKCLCCQDFPSDARSRVFIRARLCRASPLQRRGACAVAPFAMTSSVQLYAHEPSIVPMVSERCSPGERTAEVERLVYLPGLGRLLSCEKNKGAALWEAKGRMRFVARLLHGKGAQPGLIVPPDARGMFRPAVEMAPKEHSATVLDAAHSRRVALILTTGADASICAWEERPPHGLAFRLFAETTQICVACNEVRARARKLAR